MKSICLSRIDFDGTHAIGLRYLLDDARLVTGLINRNVVAKLYSGKHQGSIQELTKQLLRMRTDGYLFHVSLHSLPIIRVLCANLKQLRPGVRIFLWLENTEWLDSDTRELESIGVLLLESNLDRLISDIYSYFDPVTSPVRDHAVEHSPYLSGVLTAADLERIGLHLCAPPSILKAELLWLANTQLPSGSVVRIDAFRATSETIKFFCESVKAVKLPHLVQIHIDSSQCDLNFFVYLQGISLVNLVLSGDLGLLPPESAVWRSHITLSTSGFDRSLEYGKKGVVALHTGAYIDGSHMPSIKHLEVSFSTDPEKRKEIYTWASTQMNILSAAVIQGQQSEISSNLVNFTPPASTETSGWPKHIYGVGDSDDTESKTIFFDGDINASARYRYIPLSQLRTDSNLDNSSKFVTMHDTQDVEELLSRLENFHNSGIIEFATKPVAMENFCRWGKFGSCKLPLLRRITVTNEDELKSCRDAGNIGKLGDSFDAILLNINRSQQIESVRRGCATCAVHSECSQCIQLPKLFDGRYCEIRKKYPHTALFFELLLLSPILTSLLRSANDPIVTLEVSYLGKPFTSLRNLNKSDLHIKQPLRLKLGQHDLLWLRGSLKPIKLSVPMLLIAEAKWAGTEEEEIQLLLEKTFNVDAEVARQSMVDGIKKLKTEGIVA